MNLLFTIHSPLGADLKYIRLFILLYIINQVVLHLWLFAKSVNSIEVFIST